MAGFLGSLGSALPGLGTLASGIAGLFGHHDPSKQAMKYLQQIPGRTRPFYQPFIQAGKGALGVLQPEYQSLLQGPGQKLNQIGEAFRQSPGFKFALQQALQGAGHAAAAGGMAGSPQHEQQAMQLATNLGNQEYYNWLAPALGLYGQGLSGEQGLAAGGLSAAQQQANNIAQTLAAQGGYGYSGQAGQNAALGQNIGNIFGGGARALQAFYPYLGG